jgi:hypothetical protein
MLLASLVVHATNVALYGDAQATIPRRISDAVTLVASVPLVLVVPPAMPAKHTSTELLALVQKKPGGMG